MPQSIDKPQDKPAKRRQRRKYIDPAHLKESLKDKWPHTMTEQEWMEAYNKLNKKALADIFYGR